MDQQYEYKNATGKYSDQDLNRFATDGWELVTAKRRTLPLIGAPTDYVFKRLKKDGQGATDFEAISQKTMFRIYAWLSGVSVLIIGLMFLTVSAWVGVLWIIASGFLLPPVFKLLQNIVTEPIPRSVRISLSVILIFISLIVGIDELVNLPPEQSTTVSSTVATSTPADNALAAQQAADLAAWQKTPSGKLCAKHPGWSQNVCDAIVENQLVIGMTEEQATLSWGAPEKVNTTETAYGSEEQWVYGLGKYIYFDDGILTTIQD